MRRRKPKPIVEAPRCSICHHSLGSHNARGCYVPGCDCARPTPRIG